MRITARDRARAAALLGLMIPLTAAPLQPADSPLAPGEAPKNLGAIGACEGPAWYFTGGNRITRRDSNGNVRVFRGPSGGANGLLFDARKRLVACESRNRRIARTEPDGAITV